MEMLTDKQVKKQTNEQTELQQFRNKPSYGGDLSPCQV